MTTFGQDSVYNWLIKNNGLILNLGMPVSQENGWVLSHCVEEMLVKPSLSYKDWCRIIDRNEKVHIITKNEHRKWNSEKPEKIFKIKESGLFDNGGKTVGFSYGERETKFLIELAEKNLPQTK